MKKYLIIAAFVTCGCFVAGCDAMDVLGKVETVAEKGAEGAAALSPILGPNATAGALILASVGAIAGAVKSIAERVKKEKVAKAAVLLAEESAGLGTKLNGRASVLGVGNEVSKAYQELKSAGIIS
jgi:hypothetical protein